MKTTSFTCLLAALLAALIPSAPAQDTPPAPAPAPAPAAAAPAPSPEAAAPAPAKPAPAPSAALPPPPVAEIATLRDPEVIKTFSAMPVQANGRIKPLDTVMRYLLKRMHGMQTIKATTLNEETGDQEPIIDPVNKQKLVNEKGKPLNLSAMEWGLLTWFRPETAKALTVFIVDNSNIIEQLGLHGKDKRDRYSYNEIVPARAKLMERMALIRDMKEDKRTAEDKAYIKLALDFLDYEMMLGHFDFARAPFGEDMSSVPPELAVHVKNGKTDWAALLPEIAAYFKSNPDAAAPMMNPWLVPLSRATFGARMSGDQETWLRIFPPADKSIEVWHGPGTVMQEAMTGGNISEDDFANLARYGSLAAASANPAEFKAKVGEVVGAFSKAAAARDESGHISLELSYNRMDYFIKALVFFIVGVLFAAASWVMIAIHSEKPNLGTARFLGSSFKWLSILMGVAGVAIATTGIVVRCIIMERPPITNLYETIIFIGTACALFGLVAEGLTRKNLAIIIANIAGMIGIFLSIRFDYMEAKDTMQQLQAVLITNFWLATHVPCINLGYAASMKACLFSLSYLLLRLFNVIKAGSPVARALGSLSYAFILLGLFLSLVGTVLGGVWANYSWGRFWGWDPKENGALMIVLMTLVIMHARMGNYIREVGFHTANMLLGMITIFSWFATNQLGIGLHSYGELTGAWKWLYRSWGILTFFFLFGIILSQIDKFMRHRREQRMASSRDEMPPPLPSPSKA